MERLLNYRPIRKFNYLNPVEVLKNKYVALMSLNTANTCRGNIKVINAGNKAINSSKRWTKCVQYYFCLTCKSDGCYDT